MAHSSSFATTLTSPSAAAWMVATTLLCQSVVLGTSSAIAQSSVNVAFDPTTFSGSDVVSPPDGLDFSLAAVDPVSGGTRSTVAPVALGLSSVPSTTPSASSNSLSFDLTPPPTLAPPAAPIASEALSPSLANVFVGDTNSLVAIAIGCAEGTRTPTGGKTWAFQGHTDPGNGVWNLGTFSWQHGANSPEEADQKQLARLKKQAVTLNQQAIALGVPWGLEEQLNALDLANQSPSAALNPGGYLERLKQAHDDGLRGSEAILWARTWSYRHPSGTRWNAPGLGNTHHGIRTDQKRRMDAIAKAIASTSTPPLNPVPSPIAPPLESQSAFVSPDDAVSEPGTAADSLSPLQQRLREATIMNQLFTVDL